MDDMENWHEVFSGKIPKGNYQMQLINGEEHGLVIKLSSNRICIVIKFGIVQAVRMLDEGIVQNSIYCDDVIKRYKDNDFQNVIYEVQEGEFGKQINQISGGYGESLSLRHYVVITSNYNVDVITGWEPTIEVSQV